MLTLKNLQAAARRGDLSLRKDGKDGFALIQHFVSGDKAMTFQDLAAVRDELRARIGYRG